jgi:hypothetical protein
MAYTLHSCVQVSPDSTGDDFGGPLELAADYTFVPQSSNDLLPSWGEANNTVMTPTPSDNSISFDLTPIVITPIQGKRPRTNQEPKVKSELKELKRISDQENRSNNKGILHKLKKHKTDTDERINEIQRQQHTTNAAFASSMKLILQTTKDGLSKILQVADDLAAHRSLSVSDTNKLFECIKGLKADFVALRDSQKALTDNFVKTNAIIHNDHDQTSSAHDFKVKTFQHTAGNLLREIRAIMIEAGQHNEALRGHLNEFFFAAVMQSMTPKPMTQHSDKRTDYIRLVGVSTLNLFLYFFCILLCIFLFFLTCDHHALALPQMTLNNKEPPGAKCKNTGCLHKTQLDQAHRYFCSRCMRAEVCLACMGSNKQKHDDCTVHPQWGVFLNTDCEDREEARSLMERS